MAKKKIYTLSEVERLALEYLKDKHFGGLSPSDRDSNWNWHTIKDTTGNSENGYGIWLRFALQVFCVSFAEDLNIYPILDDGDKVLGYKHFEDLTDDEKRKLQINCFLIRANS